MSIVAQDTVLFNDTIENNIAMGRRGATHEEIVAAAKIANAHDFIMECPSGYDTNIGDRGAKLSGGQRQRPEHRPSRTQEPRNPDSGRSDFGPRHRKRKARPGRT